MLKKIVIFVFVVIVGLATSKAGYLHYLPTTVIQSVDLKSVEIMEQEIWKDITDFEGLYKVSNLGNIISLNYNRKGYKQIMKPWISTTGYYSIYLLKNGIKYRKKVHRLVAKAFVYNSDDKPEVNHLDEVKTNNRAINLDWVTHKENAIYGTASERKRIAMTNHKNISKPVAQYKMDGTLIEIYPSIKEAHRNGYEKSGVSRCCSGEYRQYKGYIWKFSNKNNNFNNINL